MRQVPIRELNQHTAEVLARVELGERLEITRAGVRIAVLEPAEPNPLGVLIESGERRVLPLYPTNDGDGHDPDADHPRNDASGALLVDR
jgi:prevent-host-death family protein